MRRIAIAAILLLTACNASPQNLEATVAAGVAMTDTALAPTPTPSVTPTATPTATATPAPTLTPTQTPVPTRIAAAKPIDLGGTLSYYPHGGESWLYIMEGKEGDEIAVTVKTSNVHPELQYCKQGARISAPYALQTDALERLESVPAGGNSAGSTYRLPYTGFYYIAVSCQGAPCNGYCAQVDTSLAILP